MNDYVEAIETRREIVRLYESAIKSKNAQDFINFQLMGDVALVSWTEKFGLLDTDKLNRQILLQC